FSGSGAHDFLVPRITVGSVMLKPQGAESRPGFAGGRFQPGMAQNAVDPKPFQLRNPDLLRPIQDVTKGVGSPVLPARQKDVVHRSASEAVQNQEDRSPSAHFSASSVNGFPKLS